jgi:EAL domain-containing protein (putative c-di-GMP-specific phosphodiesterase class I)
LKAFEEYEIPPELLEIELTESSMMSNAAQSAVLLERLSSLGVKISVDDFGTGYSSLAYLKRFPIDKLKIDIAFIRDVTTNPDDAAITHAIIQMAHSLKLNVVAEGVETAAQLQYLRDHLCDAMQGYYFSRPVAAEDFAEMIANDRTLNRPAQK